MKDASHLDKYISFLEKGCESYIKKIEKQKGHVKDGDETLLGFHNYATLIMKKWNVQQLKTVAKQHRIKVSGNKNELIHRLFVFLKLSSHAVKIQKLYRGHLQRKYNQIHGPALLKRSLCTNPHDFLTMEPMENISYEQFFSYQDADGFVYGFDILSIHNLIGKTIDKTPKNPYNRCVLTETIRDQIKTFLHLSQLLKKETRTDIRDVEEDISQEKSLELRILDLFQNIDALGNYSDASWLTGLNRNQLVKFIRELYDIWNYRAQIPDNVKRNICPPLGNPFHHVNIHRFSLLSQESEVESVQRHLLPILEKLVTTGVDKDSKSLGAYYILGALTLVCDAAAISLPWLYQSVS